MINMVEVFKFVDKVGRGYVIILLKKLVIFKKRSLTR